MRKSLIALLLIIIPLVTMAQTDNKITIGAIEKIQSKILNEDRELRIYVPNGNSAQIFSKQKYPVLYLLDGEAHFNSVVGMMEQLSANTIMPEMIIVGISNTSRMRDLSPTQVEVDLPMLDAEAAKNTGGNANLFAFMEKELFPYIEKKYQTAPYRMLIGHSLGGLTVINAMVNYTSLFNAYVAIDPSMWWDKMKFLKDCKVKLAQNKFDKIDLYLGIANTLDPNMTIETVEKDTTKNSDHIRSILALDKHLKANAQNQLNYKSKYYPDDSHNSLPLIAEYDAFRFFFGFFKLDLTMEDFMSEGLSFPQKIEKHFENVSTKMGYTIPPSEGIVNSLGYEVLGQKKFNQAEYFFKMNVKNYPESFNVYDSLGDYYVAIADKPNAIINFKKALSLKDYPETKAKLELLQKP
ncbi:alpha/beta hydrolase-fold protein [Flavobacterium buctense]|uniref:Alpha/beta hydrolase-fold protein n=1 Tax=Flavobacterium buctense TaxID=1648146 RepID=A0ABU9E1D8_9FLAO|nr:alpha/beta hydrolase-fold protein [Flavobacterium buctense]